jgi:hypothetical protein
VARPKLNGNSVPALKHARCHEAPEVTWPDPELDDGAEAPLPRLPEVELLLEPPELELPELVPPEPLDGDEPELPDEPEPPELFEAPDEPDEEEPPDDEAPELFEEPDAPEDEPDEEEPPDDEADPEDAVPWALPGSVNATVPAATRLATPTVVVVALMRRRARSRAITARATLSRSWLLMRAVCRLAFGSRYVQLLSQL